MIICPSCKEEIEEQSCYCDQCGQALMYCSNCGRVGTGRRCTHCGGLMVSMALLLEDVKDHIPSSLNSKHTCLVLMHN